MTTRRLENWIKAYLVYTNESESPENFHTWAALSAIAGVLRRNVYFNMGYFNLYPNLYVVLVSPAGLCKKSTAMRMTNPLMAKVPGVSFSVDSTTRESLIRDMTQVNKDGQSAMTAKSSEFATMLTNSGMDMVVFLTDIYDCPLEWTHRTKTGGTNVIKAPFFNLIAGTTPDWISKALPLDTIGIGLTSRVIFVYSETPRVRPPFPELSEAQVALHQLLKDDMIQIGTLSGQYVMAPEAFKLYEEWYEKRHELRGNYDPRLAGYFERKPMHVLKVAMCIAAAHNDQLVITFEDLQATFALLESTEADMHKVFAAVGKNPLAYDIEQIYSVILTHPEGIGFGKLLDMFKHSIRKEELEEVLNTLNTIGYVNLRQTDKGPVYAANETQDLRDQ